VRVTTGHDIAIEIARRLRPMHAVSANPLDIAAPLELATAARAKSSIASVEADMQSLLDEQWTLNVQSRVDALRHVAGDLELAHGRLDDATRAGSGIDVGERDLHGARARSALADALARLDTIIDTPTDPTAAWITKVTRLEVDKAHAKVDHYLVNRLLVPADAREDVARARTISYGLIDDIARNGNAAVSTGDGLARARDAVDQLRLLQVGTEPRPEVVIQLQLLRNLRAGIDQLGEGHPVRAHLEKVAHATREEVLGLRAITPDEHGEFADNLTYSLGAFDAVARSVT